MLLILTHRAQQNLAEYLPISLIVLALLELNKVQPGALHLYGTCACACTPSLHARTNEPPPLFPAGAVVTAAAVPTRLTAT